MMVMSGMRHRLREHPKHGVAVLRRMMAMLTALLLALGHVAQG